MSVHIILVLLLSLYSMSSHNVFRKENIDDLKNATRLFSKLLVSFLKLQEEREFGMCGDKEEMAALENQRSEELRKTRDLLLQPVVILLLHTFSLFLWFW